MTTPADPADRPWPRPSATTRLLPALVVVAALVALAAGSTARGRTKPVEDVSGPSLAEVRAYADDPSLPITWDEAKEAGTLDRYDWGDRCDTDRRYEDTDATLARVAVPSTYSPPCVPAWDGAKPWVSRGGERFDTNGGATARGVDAETIKVVFYRPAEMDITKQLEQFGVTDSDDTTVRGVEELVEMFNHLYETYGRRVEVIPFQGTGDGRSPAGAKADAVRVAELGAFASIGGPSQTTAYQHELARHGILCIGCGMAATDDVLLRDAPYSWGYLATPNQVLFGVFSFGTGTLGKANAIYAGTPEMRAEPRRYGIVHYEQDPPIFGPLKAAAIETYEKQGTRAQVIIQYLLDPNSLNAQAQAIIGRLKREGVTTVVFLGDPLMPRLLTQQATRQEYFPEWVFTGTAFTDMTSIGRLYDQRQMASAFGASSAAARTAPEASEAWSLYRWWYGEDPTATHTMVQWGPVIELLFLGIHQAGPRLSAATFAGGLFRYPPTGGADTVGKSGVDLFLGGYLAGDTTPRISFGFHNGNELPDFVAVDDFTPIWWDPDATGPDEAGVAGRGMWQYTGMGLRVPLADPQLPEGVGGDFLFKRFLSETGSEMADLAEAAGLGDVQIATPILTEVPPLNALPDYPPLPDSPAARGG